MREVEEAVGTGWGDGFERLSDEIQGLVAARRLGEVEDRVEGYLLGEVDEGRRGLLAGLVHYVKGEHGQAVRAFGRAGGHLKAGEYPDWRSMYSAGYVGSQLTLERRDRPATQAGYRAFMGNLAALREVDGELAGEIQRSRFPEELVLLEYWGGLHLYSSTEKRVLVLDEQNRQTLAGCVEKRLPIGFGGIGTGQEIGYCLGHRYRGLHGMARAHYVVEEETGNLRALLHLGDFREAILGEELLLFGGQGMERRLREVFGTLCYAPPDVGVGDPGVLKRYLGEAFERARASVPVAAIEAYYESAEFRGRQRRIAAGEMRPRVLVVTSRWTTFLKHCSADFAKAFEQLGCETRFVIEGNDVQWALIDGRWRELEEFRADVVFMVSHGRPTIRFYPRSLPFICYNMDYCGELVRLEDLREHISEQDLFVCMLTEYQRYFVGKGVPERQTFVMPVPVDESMFYPLEEGECEEERFCADVGFVKHGHKHYEAIFAEFMDQSFQNLKNEALRERLQRGFGDLYEATCRGGAGRIYEREMVERVWGYLPGVSREHPIGHSIGQVVKIFCHNVYSAYWRCGYLEALAKAGVALGLYGKGWQEHARLRGYDRGPVNRGAQLNQVYNFNRINLHVHHFATMHQRLTECALAGGFMLAADHPAEKDGECVRRYYEPEREVVLFDSAAELVERCRYYLGHEDERREIGQRMRQRALREQTCRMGARKVLERWRGLLSPGRKQSVES